MLFSFLFFFLDWSTRWIASERQSRSTTSAEFSIEPIVWKFYCVRPSPQVSSWADRIWGVTCLFILYLILCIFHASSFFLTYCLLDFAVSSKYFVRIHDGTRAKGEKMQFELRTHFITQKFSRFTYAPLIFFSYLLANGQSAGSPFTI